MAFPPSEDYVDLRDNPGLIERIAVARRYLPLRNFLTAINTLESPFATASATAKCGSPATASSGNAYEFASEASLVFAEPALNFERQHYT